MFAIYQNSPKKIKPTISFHDNNNNVIDNHNKEFRNYRLSDCIGRGNFGDVYKAYDLKNQRNVAIKAINIECSDDEISILLQEINLLRSLKHPNITNWFETFIIDVTMFIVMEYCSEGSCADLLKFNRNGLNENVVSYIMKNVLLGLKYLHNFKIIHRDIKAANILITNNNIIKLADFGVSGQMNGLTGKKTFVGTPYWMAPEIITEVKLLKDDNKYLEKRLEENGLGKKTLYKFWRKKIFEYQFVKEFHERDSLKIKDNKDNNEDDEDNDSKDFDDVEYDEKVDIWSLGITLIELSTGKVPNNEKEPLKVLFEIPKMEPPRLPITSSYYIKEFSVACLTKDPYLRPSADELLKFKFITKNKLKFNSLSVLSGHGNKIKKRKPKYELNFEKLNFGPEIKWDLNVEKENQQQENIKELKGNFNSNFNDTCDNDYESSSNENTFTNSFYGMEPPIRNTANTSPLANDVNGLRDESLICNCDYQKMQSNQIHKVIKQICNELHLGNDTNISKTKSIAKKAILYLNKFENALVDLRHYDAEIAVEVCRRLGGIAQ